MVASSRSVAALLVGEALLFLLASLAHAGILLRGYEHREARIAESIIGIVLLGAAAWVIARPSSARTAALAGQGFALAGTLVGAFTMIVGVGPQTAPDVVFHVLLLVVLVGGLVWTARGAPARRGGARAA